MILLDILLLIQVILRAAIAVALTQTILRRPEARSLIWLAVMFYVNAATNIFLSERVAAVIPRAPAIFAAGTLIVQSALVMFIQGTFYHDRRSPYLWFLAAAIIASLVNIGCAWTGKCIKLGLSLSAAQTAANWLWHVVIAHRAYRALADDRSVEDWVKARYRAMIWYAAFAVVVQVTNVRLYVPQTLASLLALIALISAMLSVILQFLVWVMPEGFRRWLNRRYRPAPAAMAVAISEEEVMRQWRAD